MSAHVEQQHKLLSSLTKGIWAPALDFTWSGQINEEAGCEMESVTTASLSLLNHCFGQRQDHHLKTPTLTPSQYLSSQFWCNLAKINTPSSLSLSPIHVSVCWVARLIRAKARASTTSLIFRYNKGSFTKLDNFYKKLKPRERQHVALQRWNNTPCSWGSRVLTCILLQSFT